MAGSDSLLGALVRLGLAKPRLEVLKEILTLLADGLGGFGATLWQLRREDSSNPKTLGLSEIRANPSLGRLFVLAHGFIDDSYRCAYHDLPLSRATGRAVVEGECEVPDAASSEWVDHDSAFARQAKPGSLLAVRVTFPDESLGAVTLYRKQTGEFSTETKSSLIFLAMHVAALYSAVRDRVAYQLVNDVAGIVADTAATREQVNQHLLTVCKMVSDALGCFETTIYLEDPLLQPAVYSLSATTNEGALRKREYTPSETGITPWVIRTKQPKFVLDVNHMPPTLLEQTKWVPRLKAEAATSASRAQHFSFAAVPLLTDDKVIGVMRCSTGVTAPYYLAERDVKLFDILANLVASFWTRWMRLRQLERSGANWKQFAKGIQGLGGHITDLTQKSKSTRRRARFQKEFYNAALDAAKMSIGGADALEFALADPENKTIAPVAWIGSVWDRYIKSQPTGAPLKLLDDPENIWDYAYRQMKLVFIDDTAAPDIPYARIIPETRQVLLAPVIVDTSCIGVLGVRSWNRFEDIDQATTMVQVVAMVIALYHQLTTLLTQQAQVYQDLEHQLRSPIFQAYKRIQSVGDEQRSQSTGQAEGQLIDLNAVRGLLGKARRVLGNIRLYEELASGQTVRVRKDMTSTGAVTKMLVEAAWNNRTLWVHKNIAFVVNRSSISTIKQPIPIDATLFEQVISNLFDNAGKYGAPNSSVSIDAVHDENRHFRLTVNNRAAVPLEPEVLANLGTRWFRTEAAKRFTAEGIGIGLYLVKLIVEAHGGSFIPAETDASGDTRMTVTFPLV
jgi:signal transduction histidine kinase